MKRCVGTTRSPLVSPGLFLESVLTVARPRGPEGGVFSGPRQSCGSDSALVPRVEAPWLMVVGWSFACSRAGSSHSPSP